MKVSKVLYRKEAGGFAYEYSNGLFYQVSNEYKLQNSNDLLSSARHLMRNLDYVRNV